MFSRAQLDALRRHPRVEQAKQYARDVLTGRIEVCRHAYNAVVRFAQDVDDSRWWVLEPARAALVLNFCEQFENIKGPTAGKRLIYQPWQSFVILNLFGFVDAKTQLRRFRQGLIYVPRGNGKTTMLAPLANYMTFADGEGGAEGYAAATTRDQARILFDTARVMAFRAPHVKETWGITVAAHTLFSLNTASRLVSVSSDSKTLDGLNVHFAVLDEIASHRTSEVYDVLLTALGKRTQPMMIAISTATGHITGIGRQLWDYGVRILDQHVEDERMFALIYTADEDDNVWDEQTWIKANPSWGHTVDPVAVRAIANQAKTSTMQENAFRTRHLNIWVQADEALFSGRAWLQCHDSNLSLEAMRGQRCWAALDFSTKSDLCSLALVFPSRRPDGEYDWSIITRSWLPEDTLLAQKIANYPNWARNGDLLVMPGPLIDFDTVERYLLKLADQVELMELAYDPWNAAQFAQRISAQGIRCEPFRATTQNFSPPTKELDSLMRAGRLRHDGNPVMTWAMSNVVGHYDARQNVYPKRARMTDKIDPAIATIMALGTAMRRLGEESMLTEEDFNVDMMIV